METVIMIAFVFMMLWAASEPVSFVIFLLVLFATGLVLSLLYAIHRIFPSISWLRKLFD